MCFRRSLVAERLRRRSAEARLLRLWVRIPPGAWTFFLLWVLSGRGVCDELIIRPEESYWLWCVVVCDLETSWLRRTWPTGGIRAKNKQTNTCFSTTVPHLFICMSNSRFRGPPHKYRSRGARIRNVQNFGIFVIRSIRLSRRAPSLPFSKFCCTWTLDMFISFCILILSSRHILLWIIYQPLEGTFNPP